MTNKRLLLIMNPYSGKKIGKRYLADILEKFCKQGYTPTVFMTTGPGNAKELTAAYAGRNDLVVCLGGDGTYNEVVAGLLCGGHDVPVGYIPCGSTNDFANSIRLPKSLLKAADNILSGSPRPFDVGSFGGRHFSYVASFGIFTRASYATPQSAKNSLGHLAYVLEGVKDISAITPWHLRVESDGKVFEDDYIFGAISNSTSVGGVLKMDPQVVDMNDGLLELLLIKYPQNAIELSDCIRDLQRQKYNTAMITLHSAASMTIYADESMEWTLDGEREPGHDRVEVYNLPGAVRLLMP